MLLGKKCLFMENVLSLPLLKLKVLFSSISRTTTCEIIVLLCFVDIFIMKEDKLEKESTLDVRKT